MQFDHFPKSLNINIFISVEMFLAQKDDNCHILYQIYNTWREYIHRNQNPNYQIISSSVSFSDISTSIIFNLYRDFISEMFQNVLNDPSSLQYLLIEDVELELKKEEHLYEDIFSEKTVLSCVNISDIVNKFCDRELLNFFCVSSIQFKSPKLAGLSPLILILSFLKFKQRQTKIVEYTPPKITYVQFVGTCSRIDLEFISYYFKDIQVFIIYVPEGDENTFFDNTNPNLILLPIHCTEGRQCTSSQISWLFSNIVLKLARDFDPEAVIIDFSFNFHSTKAQFILDENTWVRILAKFCLYFNYKVLIYPSNPSRRNEFWDPSYLEMIFTRSIEVLSLYREFGDLERGVSERENVISIDPHIEEDLFFLRDYYISKSFQLTTISKNILSQFNNFQKIYASRLDKSFYTNPSWIINSPSLQELRRIHSQYISNEVLIFDVDHNSESRTEVRRLAIMYDKSTPIFPLKESQFIVDYSRKTLHYLNLFLHGRYSHVEFSIPFSLSYLVPESVSFAGSENPLFDVGLCLGLNYLICVYGRSQDGKESNRVSVYDIEMKEWYDPRIEAENGNPLPRHGVTCNFYTTARGSNFLYVFGGIQSGHDLSKKWRIWNDVELYSLDFRSRIWRVRCVSKEKMFANKISWVPYLYSYALQIDSGILLFGGDRISSSVSVASKVFKFNVERESFESVTVNLYEGECNFKIISGGSINMYRDKENINYIISQGQVISRVPSDASEMKIGVYDNLERNMRIESVFPEQEWSYSQSGVSKESLRKESLCMRFISIIRKRDPEVAILIYILMSYFNAAGKEIDLEGGFIEETLKILRDDRLLQLERRLKRSFEEVDKIMSKGVLSDEEEMILRQSVVKSDKERMKVLEDWVILMLSQEMVELEVILTIERIFQRNKQLRRYHQAQFSGVTVRWFNVEISHIYSGQIIEDVGMLRDAVSNLGGIMVYIKEESSGNNRIFRIEDLERVSFWEDSERDDLIFAKRREERGFEFIDVRGIEMFPR